MVNLRECKSKAGANHNWNTIFSSNVNICLYSRPHNSLGEFEIHEDLFSYSVTNYEVEYIAMTTASVSYKIIAFHKI